MPVNENATPDFLIGNVGNDHLNRAFNNYRQHVADHVNRHYEIEALPFQGTRDTPSNIGALDFLHYHVYGDYRLEIDNTDITNTPRLRYVRRANNSNMSALTNNRNPLNNSEVNLVRDQINGIVDNDGNYTS